MTTFSYKITMDDSEMIMMEAALQLMVKHCADNMVDGPEAPFWAWKTCANQVLSRLHSNTVQTSGNNFWPTPGEVFAGAGEAKTIWIAVGNGISESRAQSGAPLPAVTGRPTKDAGIYKLGSAPDGLVEHNLASWKIISAILEAYGTADFFDLAVAVRGHKHGTKAASGPQSFVSYCIRRGWLQRA